MADDGFYEQDGLATLRVPFVFIPDGAPQPVEWLAAHPNHFRVPAKFVPAQPQLQQIVASRSAPAKSREGRADKPSSRAGQNVGHAPIEPSLWRKFPPPPQIDGSGYFKENPVAAYLRINQTFDGVGVGKEPVVRAGPMTEAAGGMPEPSHGLPAAAPTDFSDLVTSAAGTRAHDDRSPDLA